jgi:hypothetical protein
MKQLCLLVSLLFTLACSADISIEETTYEGRTHFLVKSQSLEYFYDIQGGGFSRIIDQEGRDWVSFRIEPWGSYPASAASAFRGLPNLVFQGEDDGAGHPGHDKCISRAEANKIITSSRSGLWEWSWEFFDNYAVLDVLKTDPERSYWFLYEGTPGGAYKPGQSYFGSHAGGPYPATHDYYQGDILWGDFYWMYAGSSDAAGTLFMIQEKQDKLKDMISFLGNTEKGMESPDGMTVFGFGRGKEATPLLQGKQRFIIGLYPDKIHDRKTHEKLHRYIENHFLNKHE